MGQLRRPFGRLFNYDWKFGLFLILLFGIPRFILVMHANVSGGYRLAFIIFFLMWFAPFAFLTGQGRKDIGMKRPIKYIHLLYSFLSGVLSCAVIFGVFLLLFGKTEAHAFVYIGRTGMPDTIPAAEKLVYFLIAAIPSMIFSPIGEEFLYRGVIHGSFAGKFGESTASVFDSLAFALTHLANFGLVYSAGVWKFLPLPALLWVLSMFALSRVFFRCRQMSGSIYGPVFSHAGFNLAMMYFIFYHL